jgi:hypothetical protein
MKARKWLAILFVAPLALACVVAHAGEKVTEERGIDTEFIFGFTEGADVGEVGENELEHETIASLAKRKGSYSAITDQLRYENAPFSNFRFEIGAPVAYHAIAGVPGLDDRQQLAFDGLLMQMRYRLLDREHALFGFTVGIEPHWNRVDETRGEAVDNYGGDVAIALDKELIENSVFGAFNFVYDPEVTRSRVTGLWQRESTFGLFGAVTTQLQTGIFVGAEARYLRKYDALAPEAFAGEALFVGPTTFLRLSKTLAISGSWGVQVAGRAAGDPGSLDLTNFTRHLATFRVEYNF